jgi:hypothetical protein
MRFHRETALIKLAVLCLVAGVLMGISPEAVFAQSAGQSAPHSARIADSETSPTRPPTSEGLMTMDDKTSTPGAAEMKAAQALTTKVLAIGTWTAKATPEKRPQIMPAEARDTLRLQLAGKIDQWFAKSDGSGAVFLMNVTDPAEAHTLLEGLPLGRAEMMTFELIPVGPLWPLGLLLSAPAK